MDCRESRSEKRLSDLRNPTKTNLNEVMCNTVRNGEINCYLMHVIKQRSLIVIRENAVTVSLEISTN